MCCNNVLLSALADHLPAGCLLNLVVFEGLPFAAPVIPCQFVFAAPVYFCPEGCACGYIKPVFHNKHSPPSYLCSFHICAPETHMTPLFCAEKTFFLYLVNLEELQIHTKLSLYFYLCDKQDIHVLIVILWNFTAFYSLAYINLIFQ